MKYTLILDLDGTLYNFDGKEGGVFHSSQFYKDLKENMISFIMKKRNYERGSAVKELERIHQKYNGEISMGIEAEYGIDTVTYFNQTWNLTPDKYILKDEKIYDILKEYKGRLVLLTAAPSVWANLAIEYLGIEELFEGVIYTGESKIRKPDLKVFQKIVDDYGAPANEFISIGDQEYSDIIPAKRLGMKTVLIGNNPGSIADFQANNIVEAVNILRKEKLL